jgi:DNA polymerase I
MLPLATIPAPDTATVMLIDTYGLVYRAFFALPSLTTTKGVPINAVYGFTMMLTKIINDEKPTHVVAAFDRGMPQARVELFADYKAHRQETPDDLRSQFALVRRVLATYRIPILEIEGQEADDVIATLARQIEDARQRSLVVTGDLDLLQVVDERTTILMTRRGITELARYDEAAVRARFDDLEPAQLADYRGLKGDPSDNLPGIPGVGEKTAIKLIKAAGSLDALLANPALAGSPKLEKLIVDFGKQAVTCRDVSVMARDLPIEMPWEAARYEPPSNDGLYTLYRELEFKTLLSKLQAPKDAPPIPSGQRLEGAYQSFVASTDPPDFKRLAALLYAGAASKRIALAARADELGVSMQDGSGVAFLAGALAIPEVGRAFGELWDGAEQVVTHDAKALFAKLGRAPRQVADDTMVAAHLLNPSRAYTNLSDAVSEHLGKELPDDAAAWADAVSQLAHKTRHELALREQTALYDDVELPLVTVLAKIEQAGVALDPAALADLSKQIDRDVARLQNEIYVLAGETFNIGSPQQLGQILFEKLKLPAGKQNKTGWATGVEVLQSLARDHPICAKVLEYREVSKLKNTYVDVLPGLVDPRDGRVHTELNQTATATGRLSSTNPNLQNIPVRSDLGRQIRRAFVAPSKDRVLLAADYSQIELRLMAHLSGDEAMRTAFHEGADIHDFTARQIFGIGPIAPVSANERRMAKAVNFGLLYGMSDFGLAQRLEIGRAEAKAITTQYFARFPTVRGWIDRNLEEGRERGYVATILGRRRYMPDLRAKNYMLRAAAEREATNAPLQGSASDLMKLAMVRIDRALEEARLDAVMTLQIHDELIFEVPERSLDRVAALVRDKMEQALELAVPIVVTLKSGRNWYEVESLDLDL